MAQELSHKGLLLTSTSRAFGSIQRYIQGPGEIYNCFELGKRFGTRFFFVVDSGVYDLVKDKIESIEDKCGCTYAFHSFLGECCMENVHMLADIAKENSCDVIFGIGGGKVLDTVKLAADEVNCARIIVPTSASSDAPAADWAALYDINGISLGGIPTKRCTELVLVDSEIIVGAPARLFAAGIADALVTWFEAKANYDSLTPNYIGRGYFACRAGMALARECYDVLLRDGKKAYNDVKNKVLTPAVENVIEANILLSGMGFMNGGCAGSHGIHNGMSEVKASLPVLHGEKVAFGLVCQLIMENASEELMNSTLEYLTELNLPVTLAQIGIEMTDEDYEIAIDHMLNKNSLVHREPCVVNADVLKNTIKAADAIGRRFLAEKAK